MELVINGELNPEILETKDGKLYYSGSLDLRGTGITSLPDNLSVGGYLDLSDTGITNYPVVYNCGNKIRAIYLDIEDKRLIHIGCFIGNEAEAIHAIKEKYEGNSAESYIAKVRECFRIWEQIKNKQEVEA